MTRARPLLFLLLFALLSFGIMVRPNAENIPLAFADTPFTGTPSLTTGLWELVTVSNSPPPRRDAAIAYDAPRHRLILFGGRDPDNILNDTWIFDLNTERWHSVTSDNSPPARFSVVAGVDEAQNRFLITTGQRGSTFFNDMWSFDLLTDTWSQVATQGELPAPRYGAAGGSSTQDGALYLSHGFTDEGRFDDTWRFDFATNTWQEVTPSGTRPLPRCLHAASVTAANGLVLFGGCASGYGPCPLNDTWLFNTATATWSEIATPITIEARLFPGLATMGNSDTVLLFGGQGVEALNDSWVLDTANREWTALDITGDTPPARYGHSMVWVPDQADGNRGTVLVFGGQGDSDMYSDLWRFTPDQENEPLEFALFLPFLHRKTP